VGIHKPGAFENRKEAMNRKTRSPSHNSSTAPFSAGSQSPEPNVPSLLKSPRMHEQQPISLQHQRLSNSAEIGEETRRPSQSHNANTTDRNRVSCSPGPHSCLLLFKDTPHRQLSFLKRTGHHQYRLITTIIRCN
jgi:hypothetical protein